MRRRIRSSGKRKKETNKIKRDTIVSASVNVGDQIMTHFSSFLDTRSLSVIYDLLCPIYSLPFGVLSFFPLFLVLVLVFFPFELSPVSSRIKRKERGERGRGGGGGGGGEPK